MIRKLQTIFVLFLFVLPKTPGVQYAARFAQSWWKSRAQILTLTGVNVGLTTINEFVCRTLITKKEEAERYGFHIVDERGRQRINWQSMVNIWMTLFTSLIGGVVFFVEAIRRRFRYFVLFGLSLSVLSQLVSSFVLHGVFALMWRRLLFDFIYLATIKYFSFEVFRGPITRLHGRWLSLFVVREVQDFMNTTLRVFFLNAMKLQG